MTCPSASPISALTTQMLSSTAPAPRETVSEHPIELADMPKVDARRNVPNVDGAATPEHLVGLPRAQHLTVLDAVRPQAHRRQAHHLASRVRRTRTVARAALRS